MNTAEDFRAALEREEFMISRCRRCEAASSADVTTCHSCGSPDIAWTRASGRATVISWSRIPARDQHGEDALVVIAALAEGPWCWAALANTDLELLRVGAELEVRTGRTSTGAAIPVFLLRPES